LFGLFDAGAPAVAPVSADYPAVPPWDLRDTCVREKQALGFYVSGHPLDRYGDIDRLDLSSVASLAGMEPWAKVRVAGMVEGYREKYFKGSGGNKTAFFELEDKTGRISVRMRDQHIDKAAALIAAGDPVVVSGALRFPERQDDAIDEADAGPQQPTLLLDKIEPLQDIVASTTRSLTLRLRSDDTTPGEVEGLADVLRNTPGSCPVALILCLPEGAEVQLALPPELRVAPVDDLFASLERHFGRQVTELR
jgi:DNA polymerase-3 subunit alpha